MYYILNPNYALRSWWLVPYAYYTRHRPYAKKLTAEEFDFLLRCDGQHELPVTPLSERLLAGGMIAACEHGAAQLSPWQRHMDCNNRYVPHMMLSLTGRCNFNCLHCFNAVDNAHLQSELSMEQLDDILDQAQACGVNGIALTGGEPMLHPQFFEIVAGIYRRGMYLMELVTNGYFLDRAALDRLASLGANPLIKISFDGLGYHDWMRGVKNVEQRTLDAIALCVDSRLRTVVHVNINKKNCAAMLPTLRLLDGMGVYQARLLCTTPVPRWEQNAAGQNMSFTEYYDAALDIAAAYAAEAAQMELVAWQFLEVNPRTHSYHIPPVRCTDPSAYRATTPRCARNRGRMSIAATGEVLPCLQMTGWMEAHGISFGNIKQEEIASFLQLSQHMSLVDTSVGELAAKNDRCGSCRFFPYCNGGCPAFGILYDHFDPAQGLVGTDASKCCFFENGYYHRIVRAMPPTYHNRSECAFLRDNC